MGDGGWVAGGAWEGGPCRGRLARERNPALIPPAAAGRDGLPCPSVPGETPLSSNRADTEVLPYPIRRGRPRGLRPAGCSRLFAEWARDFVPARRRPQHPPPAPTPPASRAPRPPTHPLSPIPYPLSPLEVDMADAETSGAVGFLTDTTLCIGCKACEVACKQWNGLPADDIRFTGFSYDNTVDLGATTWRHVAFIERPATAPADLLGSPLAAPPPPRRSAAPTAWLMLSDVCKHCAHAGCLEACPTGAIVRTEFGSVYIQPDICNGDRKSVV